MFPVQAGKAPHTDISMAEVEGATRRCEHLLYLQRRQRAALGSTARQHGRLLRLASTLRDLAAGQGSLPDQVSPRARVSI